MKRQLYQCSKARCNGKIYCAAGHYLNGKHKTVLMECLERGSPLAMTACQACEDYDEIGPPIPKGERGWIHLDKRKRLLESLRKNSG